MKIGIPKEIKNNENRVSCTCLLYTSITSILIAEKVPTPGFINFQRDGTFANIYAGAPEEKSYA